MGRLSTLENTPESSVFSLNHSLDNKPTDDVISNDDVTPLTSLAATPVTARAAHSFTTPAGAYNFTNADYVDHNRRSSELTRRVDSPLDLLILGKHRKADGNLNTPQVGAPSSESRREPEPEQQASFNNEYPAEEPLHSVSQQHQSSLQNHPQTSIHESHLNPAKSHPAQASAIPDPTSDHHLQDTTTIIPPPVVAEAAAYDFINIDPRLRQKHLTMAAKCLQRRSLHVPNLNHLQSQMV